VALITQIVPKVFWSIGWGTLTGYGSILGGDSAVINSSGYIPMPLAGTIRRISVYAIQDRSTTVTVTVMKNGVATGLTITLNGGAAGATGASADSVDFSVGDVIAYRFVTHDLVTPPGFALAVTAEIIAEGLQSGIAAGGGTVIVTEGFVGGALGNGGPENTVEGYGSMGSSYSLCPIAGSATRIQLRRFTSQSGGSWRAYLLKNGVVQNGSGGTVDTRITLDDADPDDAGVDFSMPIAPHDRVSVATIRDGTTASFGNQVAAGVAVAPDDGAAFMFCGGNNDTIPNSGTTWKWNASQQNGATEAEHTAYAGLTSFKLSQLYVERSVAPGTGESVAYSILRNGGLSGISATIADSATSNDGSGSQVFDSGTRLTIRILNSDAPANGQLHWGVAGTMDIGEEIFGTPGGIAWVHARRIVP
jgi:hypothetical protein